MPLSYHVEHESESVFPTIRDFGSGPGAYRAACAFARRKSDAIDGSAYVVASEIQRDEDGHRREVAVGHVGYVWGRRSDVDGRVRGIA